MKQFALRVGDDVHELVKQRAWEERLSANAWIVKAISEALRRDFAKQVLASVEKVDEKAIAQGIVQGQIEGAVKSDPFVAAPPAPPNERVSASGKVECAKCGCQPKRKTPGCRAICYCPAHTEAP